MATTSKIEVETFVHGAMCMAYSGRCLLSGYMKNRESNRGMCCQPCRFNYTVMEETRPGQHFPIVEDERGAYIFNSRDLCMIEHIPAMIDAGIRSLKIEGRMKTIHYLAAVVKVYREAIDLSYSSPDAYTAARDRWETELEAVSNRGYCTGFYFGSPEQTSANLDNITRPGYLFAAKVTGRAADGGVRVLVKNKIKTTSTVNVLSPEGPARMDCIEKITDRYGVVQKAAQPGTTMVLKLRQTPKPLDLIRLPSSETNEP
jgi:putative protease